MSDPGSCGRRMVGQYAIAAFLLFITNACLAIDEFHFEWAELEGNGWKLLDARLVLDWSEMDQSILRFEAARIEFGSEYLEQIELRCTSFRLTMAEVVCPKGQLTLGGRLLQAQKVSARFHYRRTNGELSVAVSGLETSGGQLDIILDYSTTDWQLEARLRTLDLTRLARLLNSVGISQPALDVQGDISGKLVFTGNAQRFNGGRWELDIAQAGYSNADGSQAAEELVLFSRGKVSPGQYGWNVDAAVEARQGMLYAEPLYLEFSGERPLSLSSSFHQAADGRLRVSGLTISQPGVVTVHANGVLHTALEPRLQELDLQVRQAHLPALYEIWLQPWLAGTALEQLDTEGQLRGRLRLYENNFTALRLQLDGVSFSDSDGQFSVEGLEGGLRWDNNSQRQESILAWKSLGFYQLRTGSASVRLESAGRHLRLVEPLVVPLLDGLLHVHEFEAGQGDDGVYWLLDGQLTPVSMQDFSAALGWTPLSGKLSGMIPKMRYQKGVLSLGGILLVQAFDGAITLRNLRIEQPLGLVPRLWLDARMENVDLKTLTSTFSFGRIEGRVAGELNQLYMEAWQPVAFDAFIGTPDDDTSRHRISQRAVDNISDLGGTGVSGALSRGFLQLLEDFPYQRLGIRCRLENGVCHMGGIAPAGQGYYLVQGRFLPPRLDVIGYVDEVDWQSLIDRLATVTAEDSPHVE